MLTCRIAQYVLIDEWFYYGVLESVDIELRGDALC